MSFNIKIFLLCPIPDDQKPINEYLTLKDKDFTKLLLLNSRNYFFKIFLYFLSFSGLGFLVSFLVSLKTKVFLFNLFFAITSLFLTFFVNLASWSQISKRFCNSRIFYEEGSWYDAQIWEKPIELIKNDKLINNLKMKPILKRLFKTISILSFLVLISAIDYLWTFKI
jgi:hypothetical protein